MTVKFYERNVVANHLLRKKGIACSLSMVRSNEGLEHHLRFKLDQVRYSRQILR
jgi:hypothetical protein